VLWKGEKPMEHHLEQIRQEGMIHTLVTPGARQFYSYWEQERKVKAIFVPGCIACSLFKRICRSNDVNNNKGFP
jgi:hypothetical protein